MAEDTIPPFHTVTITSDGTGRNTKVVTDEGFDLTPYLKEIRWSCGREGAVCELVLATKFQVDVKSDDISILKP